MNIAFDFFPGLAFGIEFPGEGLYVVLHLGIVRIMVCSSELFDKL